jgi:hypothetical protein
MAGLFEGIAPPNVETTRTTEQKAPGFLTDYLTNLAKAGSEALGTTTTDASGKTVFTPKTGADLIAPMSDLQKSAYDKAGGLLSQYRTPLDEALKAGRSAMEVSADDISKFYDPYQQEVIDAMREASDVNLQRSVLPGLKAIGIGSGQFGGRRAGVLGGQALSDLAAALSREESGLRSAGFKTALDAALREQGQQTGAANALTNLGQTEFQAGLGEAKGLAELGAQQTAYDQSKIDAPLTRAANVAQLLRGYSFPTTTTETYKGPANVYGPSPLSQIAGLGTLLGAAFPTGGQGFGDRALNTLRSLFGAGAGNISPEELANLSNQAKLDLIGLGDLPPSFGGAGTAPYTEGDQGSDSGEGLFGPSGG